MGWMCENNEKQMIFLCKHPTFVLCLTCLTCLRWRSEQVVCRKDWIKKTFLMGFLYTIFFLFSFIGLIHSVQLTHSEMTFGCQAAAQGAPASTAKVFLRLNLQSLRWIASLFLIKPSLTCSIAPSLQNANILLVCILVFLPTLENSRTPCLFVHFTKGRVSVFDVQKTII